MLKWTRLSEQRKAGLAAEKKRSADMERLRSLRAARDTVDNVDTARAKLKAAADAETLAGATVDRLRSELQRAESDLRVATTVRVAAADLLAAAERDNEAIAALEQTLTGDLEAIPSEDDVAAAQRKWDEARDGLAKGNRARDALRRLAEAEANEEKADDAREAAEELRDTAKATGDVLSRIVAGMGGAFAVDKEFRLDTVPKVMVRGF